MSRTFIRTLAVTAVVQFAITRTLAGQAIEEGRAERLWLMYPLNVLLNTLAWTLLLTVSARFLRLLRGS